MSARVKFWAAWVATAVAVLVSGAGAQTWQCGASGSSLTCTKTGDTLTVSGAGRMKDYVPSMTEQGDAPWGDGLRTVVIGEGVTHIGQSAFKGNSNLNAVIVSETNPPDVDATAFNMSPINVAILRVPQGSVADYKSADVWKDFGYINPSTVTFNARNGTDPTTKLVSYGDTVAKPADPYPPTSPSIIIHTFGGWYKEPEAVNAWDFNTVVLSDMTLYANWDSDNITSVLGQNSPNTSAIAVRQTGRVLKISTPNRAAAVRYGVELYSVSGKRQRVSPVYHADGVITVALPHVAAGSYVLRVGGAKSEKSNTSISEKCLIVIVGNY